jgi:hypothetical protein
MSNVTDNEYKIASTGETITIVNTPAGYDVACWDAEDANRWIKHFKETELTEALAEYNRWRQ